MNDIMEKNCFNWYRENGFPGIVVTSAEELTSFVEGYYGITFDSVFISNAKNGGEENYPSLWLFNKEYAVECKGFISRFDIDLVKYNKNVSYVNVISDKADSLDMPTLNSTMKVDVVLKNGVRCILQAAGLNCQRLNVIAKRYINNYLSELK